MTRFYETTFFELVDDEFDAGTGVIGWQLLASPAEIDEHHVVYRRLVEEMGDGEPITSDKLAMALAFVGDPWGPWRYSGRSPIRHPRTRRRGLRRRLKHETSLEIVERVLDEPIFAAELSPLRARSLAELAALATTIVVVSLGDVPTIVLVGEAVGLIVVRPLTAVGGALWSGARDEVEDFGADSSAALLDALRQRLGIRHRKEQSPSTDDR